MRGTTGQGHLVVPEHVKLELGAHERVPEPILEYTVDVVAPTEGMGRVKVVFGRVVVVRRGAVAVEDPFVPVDRLGAIRVYVSMRHASDQPNEEFARLAVVEPAA